MIQFTPNHQKILETILWIANAKPRIDRYHLVKLMFLADKAHVNKHARPVSSDNYVAMEYGPVPSETLRMLNNEPAALRKLWLKEFPFHFENNDRDKPVIIVPAREANSALLSKSDISLLQETLEKYGDWPFNRLRDFTHADPAYKQAWANRGEKKSYPIDYASLLTNGHATDDAREELAYIAKYAMS